MRVQNTQEEEFFAIKGGSRAGVYYSMADAIQAKSEGGGTFAAFTSEEQAHEFATPVDRYVVWKGRKIGIMCKAECIEATQQLNAAKMRGPMSEEEAFDVWGQKQAFATVITSKASTASKPATAKKGKKKKKKYYYAVAIGKVPVPGVYDDWRGAERQVKAVMPNRYAKFATKHKNSWTRGERKRDRHLRRRSRPDRRQLNHRQAARLPQTHGMPAKMTRRMFKAISRCKLRPHPFIRNSKPQKLIGKCVFSPVTLLSGKRASRCRSTKPLLEYRMLRCRS